MPSIHDIPKYETNNYYAGLSPNDKGPKLVLRTSTDVFEEPKGPEAYKRIMRLCHVDEDHELAKDGLWNRLRNEVVVVLDRKRVKLTSVDLVRFTWPNEPDDQGKQQVKDDSEYDSEYDSESSSEDDKKSIHFEDFATIKPVDNRYITPPTVWIGVLPDTLSADLAYETAQEILGLLKQFHITSEVDVAFRESVARRSHGPGPALYPPAFDLDPLKEFIDNISTPLSLPVCGFKTDMQGTLSFLFRVGNELFGVTDRHVLFADEEGNDEYKYKAGPKKYVVVMGSSAFNDYVASIQAKIGTLNDTVKYLEKRATTYKRKKEEAEEGTGSAEAQRWALDLEDTERELARTRANIEKLRDFFMELMKNWSKPKDRIIGYVDWSPPIGVGVLPHRYTRDVAVIKMNKKKYEHLMGNVLSLGAYSVQFCFRLWEYPWEYPLGPELSREKLMGLMYGRVDVPHEFEYPEQGLLPLKGILSATDLMNPTSKNLTGEMIRRGLKRGFKTLTTVGTISMFMSHVRLYFATGNMDSVEVPILPHELVSGPFSRSGDSGAAVVDALCRFVAVITGGTGKTDTSDITFATLMEWLWGDVILDEYPGANLYFEDIKAFLAAA
ncbi:hypothetical protein F5I97DRAFT_1816563 [Phlebopus sp. FC_14]|nr:hypothetical protein F5I97DRAFT_1816563 [Phlebopus sp. FC_14]